MGAKEEMIEEHNKNLPTIRVIESEKVLNLYRKDVSATYHYDQGARHMLTDVIQYLESQEYANPELDYFREQLKILNEITKR